MKNVFINSKVQSFYLMSHRLLANKYNVNYHQYIINKINILLKHSKTQYTCLFKESIICSDLSEYVNAFYTLNRSNAFLRNIKEKEISEKHFASEKIRKLMFKRVKYKKRAIYSFQKNKKEKNKQVKYSIILPLNTEHECKDVINSKNNKLISTVTENTIYNNNNDISFSIDLHINKNYDYKIIDKYNDFINTSISSLNSIVNKINNKCTNNTRHQINQNKFIRKRNHNIKSYLPYNNYTKAISLFINQTTKKQRHTNSQYNNNPKNKLKTCSISNNDYHSILNKNGSSYQSQSNLQFNPTCTSTPIKKRIPSFNDNNHYNTVNNKQLQKPCVNNGINQRLKILKKTKEKCSGDSNNQLINRNLFLTNYNGFGVKKDNKNGLGGKNNMYLSKFGFKYAKTVGGIKKEISPAKQKK